MSVRGREEDLMTAARTRATVTLMVPETTTVLHVRARDVREEITVTVTRTDVRGQRKTKPGRTVRTGGQGRPDNRGEGRFRQQ